MIYLIYGRLKLTKGGSLSYHFFISLKENIKILKKIFHSEHNLLQEYLKIKEKVE
jgi:hypothetical protein